MDPIAISRILVLTVLAAPLAAAIAVGLLGRVGNGVRRAALSFALIHLALTGLLAFFVYNQLLSRVSDFSMRPQDSASFSPVSVPGADHVSSNTTEWVLLALDIAQDSSVSRLPAAEVQFFLGLDGLNIWLVVLTSLMTLIAIWVSWGSVRENAGSFYAWLFVLETGVLGAFLAFDVILFYVFFELTLIPAFFLIGNWGVGGNRRDAARKFFLYTLLGSLFTLTGLVGVVLTNPSPYEVRAGMTVENKPTRTVNWSYYVREDRGRVVEAERGPVTFSIPMLMRNVQYWSEFYYKLVQTADRSHAEATRSRVAAADRAAAAPNDSAARLTAKAAQAREEQAEQQLVQAQQRRDAYKRLQLWLFLALMAGFAVKIPIVPFHTWLPAAYSEAPLGVTLLLSAVLAKLGTFGIIRVVLPLVPDAAFEYGLPVFGFLAAAGIVYAALCAVAQRDAKLLVAYSSVSHLGLLVLGLFAMNPEGLSGAVLHMVNHGLTVGAMFALLGFLSERYGTLDMNQYGGLFGRFPAYAFLTFVIALAAIGLPGLNNFVGEMLILCGLFDPVHTGSMGYGLAVAAAFGVFLSAWYTMTFLRRVFFGPLQEPPTAAGVVRDVKGRELLAFGVPAVLCVVLGLYPQPLLDTMRYDVQTLVHVTNAARVRAGYDPTDRFTREQRDRGTPTTQPSNVRPGNPPQPKAGPAVRP